MRRFPFVVLVATLLLGSFPLSASAASGCLYDAPSATASVTVADGAVTVAAVSGAITVDAIACASASVSNTDTIAITTTAPGDQVTIDLSTGTLTPGATNEGDGSSEVEVQIDGTTFSLIVAGRATADRFGLGLDATDPSTGVMNLNDSEFGWDADITFPEALLDGVTVNMGDGSDWFAANLNADGAADRLDDRPVTVSGGGGADRMQAHAQSIFDGGGGGDMLALDWLGAGCSAVINNGATAGVASTIEGCTSAANGDLEVTNAETLVGTNGDDSMFGTTWSEDLIGLGGDDVLVPSLGDDSTSGGKGQDQLVADSDNGKRFTFDLTAKTLFGQGTDTFSGIEILSSTSAGADTFVGDPWRTLRFVSGGGGLNVLNLSSASQPVQVRTQAGVGLDTIEAGWILAQGVLVIGTPYGDRMVGMPGAFANDHDEFRGMGGDDRLEGAAGSDTLLGGTGEDLLLGGLGVDTCAGGPGDDTLKSCEN